MTQKIVLSVGQCRPDQAAISHMLTSRFSVQVVAVDDQDAMLSFLKGQTVALILINRKLDKDYSDGLELLQTLKRDENLAGTPVMVVSNFPEWQDKAVQSGAIYGFGKAELAAAATIDRLRAILGDGDN